MTEGCNNAIVKCQHFGDAMTCKTLPQNTLLSPRKFIDAMNKALSTLTGYTPNMCVCCDENGYWLEVDGVRQGGYEDLLSSARKLVLDHQ